MSADCKEFLRSGNRCEEWCGYRDCVEAPAEPVGGTPKVIIIHSPKMPGGVMKGYVSEEDYRQLERELSGLRAELERTKSAH